MESKVLDRKLVRLKQRGQLTLPSRMRRELGLKEGDLVEVTRTDDGLRITPQEVIAMRALDEIGRLLKERGVTLDDLMTSGRELRGQVAKEMYGLEPEKDR